MNDKDQNFGRLKRLLKLKRQEVPPPGYFNNFSRDVIARLRAEAQTSRSQPEPAGGWAGFMQFLRSFESRPGLVAGVAGSLCLLLILGAVFVENFDSGSPNSMALASIGSPMLGSVPSTAPTLGAVLAPASESSGLMISTNPDGGLLPGTTLFGTPSGAAELLPASFTPEAH